MAGTYPERVGRIVYLDAAYDWSDRAYAVAFESFPYSLTPPISAMASLDACRAYLRTVYFPVVRDANRFEAFLRDWADIQADGTVRQRMNDSAAQALWATLLADRREYTKVRAPALAIYAETFLEVRNGDSAQLAKNLAWEQTHMVPFRAASMERVRRELFSVEIMSAPGTHLDFIYTSREQVVAAMRGFLSGPPPQN